MVRLPRVALFALVTLYGCTPSTTVPGGGLGASPADLVGRACSVDAECGALRCDPVRRQCVCLTDDSCRSPDPAAPPRYCNNYTGLCVSQISGCTSDTDCKDGSGAVDDTAYCDPSTRSCRPRKGFCEACANDGECGGAQDNCVLDQTLGQRFCARACAQPTDCPRGSACKTVDGQKQCWPAENPLKPNQPVTCQDFRGCTPDALRSCDSQADCADLDGQKCDPSRGKCVAMDQVCPFGTVCDPRDRICVVECSVDTDCGDVNYRCQDRICEPVGECTSDAQCPANKVCNLLPSQTVGTCAPFCQRDADCPLGQLCQRGDDDRYRCVAGCTAHAGCPLDQRCNMSTRKCEANTPGGGAVCQATSVCGACELCNLATLECAPAKAAFPYCAPCQTSTECAGGSCVQMDDGRFCAKSCGQGQECAQGFVCLPIGSGGQSACVPSDKKCVNKCL